MSNQFLNKEYNSGFWVQQVELGTGANLEGKNTVALFDELGRNTAAAREQL